MLAGYLPSRLRAALADPELAGLAGHFHTHVTVAAERLDDLARIPGAHLTVIDLAGTREQQDVMLTVRHHGAITTLAEGLLSVLEALHALEVPVLRVKVEHGSLPTVPTLSRRRYREAHLKLRLDRDHLSACYDQLHAGRATHGYALSRNPREQAEDHVVQFVNLRIYDGSVADASARVDALANWLTAHGMPPIEVRQETAIVDTALEHDSWWS